MTNERLKKDRPSSRSALGESPGRHALDRLTEAMNEVSRIGGSLRQFWDSAVVTSRDIK